MSQISMIPFYNPNKYILKKYSVNKDQIISDKIRQFYDANIFPDFDIDKYTFIEDLRERAGWFFRLLEFYLPININIVDVGCGTGQFACFLATKPRKLFGIDFSDNSLKKANLLKQKLNLPCVNFIKMDLLNMAFPGESFDYTFCCGVLHHTADPYRGFKNLVKITKSRGFIVIGLYNRYGRFFLKIKRFLIKLFLRTNQKMIQQLIKRQLEFQEKDDEKIRSWYIDQYVNPHESTHTIAEVLRWFRENDVTYINSFPPIEPFRSYPYSNFERLQANPFLKKDYEYLQINRFANFITQLKWIITLRNTGGYFVIIGQKAR